MNAAMLLSIGMCWNGKMKLISFNVQGYHSRSY